jgi:hypothetical protein
MTQLELQQRGLLDLIKRRGDRPRDPYLARVSSSAGLRMIREIAIWWRAFQLETQCHFTSRLLKHHGYFNSLVKAYFNSNATSAYVEELSYGFLTSLLAHPDPLVRSVAQFERAFLGIRAGSDAMTEVVWDRNPDSVFLALDRRSTLPDPDNAYVYCMQIGRDLQTTFTCTRELR